MTHRTILQTLVMTGTIVLAGLALGQEADEQPTRSPARLKEDEDLLRKLGPPPAGHLEVPRDPYIPVLREGRATTPAVRWTRDGYVSVQVNVDAHGDNIVGDAANEPSIAVDPTDRGRMVIGWRQFDSVTSDFRQAGYGYTADGGQSWTFPGVVQPGEFRSDPVMCVDTQGDFFYNSLTASAGLTDFWCNVYRSVDGGASWDAGVYAYGGDKQWMVVDLTDGMGRDNMYAYWTRWYTCPGCDGHFTRSYDDGQTFLPTIDVPGSPFWGVLAVGPDGELYVAGDGFTVTKSTTMQDETLPPQWDFTTTVNLDGSMGYSGGPNPGGLLGQVWIAVDHSDGPSRGNVYLLCSVQRYSTADPLDVMFARSTDGGATWSSPARVNDDPEDNGAYQWFGTMSVAPNGRIDVIWADSRNDPGGYDSELYYAYSEDAGITWSPNEALSPPFDPHIGWPQQNKLGDYYDMISDNPGADVAYAATFNGEQDVYYLRIGDTCTDAGTVTLDRPKYACESTAHIVVSDCGLNTNDDLAEQVTVDIDSDSETGIEQVLLTESSPSSARFEGSIDLSESNEAGVLLITENETVTVTYLDADDGQGGSNIEVTASAVVDCTAPVIYFVQTIDIGPLDATVTFQTLEACRGAVRYGESCDALTETAARSGYMTEHAIRLTGLQEDSIYFYAADAEDEAGNSSTDDNGSVCYTFTTLDVPSYFTELFDSSDNDLEGLSLWFTPNGSYDRYDSCVETIDELPTDPDGGTTLGVGEDGYVAVGLTGGATVELYGVSYGTFYVGSNGYITFTSGDNEWAETLTDHFDLPRISALFDDFSPQNGGPVSWKQLDDRAVVTYEDVPEYTNTGSNTFQIEMYFDGRIVLSYLSITASDGIAGLSAGDGVPGAFYETDLSAMAECGDCNGNGVPDDEDIAMGTSQDCNGNSIPDECDIASGTSPDCNDNAVPDECDVSAGTSPDSNGNGIPDECEVGPPALAASPHHTAKNRYVSFAPSNGDIIVAFQVEMTASAYFPESTGVIGWVDKPGTDGVARIQGDPVLWDQWPSLVHVGDCGIVPVATYAIRTTVNGVTFSDPFEVATIAEPVPKFWGDVVGQKFALWWTPPNGMVNMDDVLAGVQRFRQLEDAPHLTWVDVDPEVPNVVLNFTDIFQIVRGFKGEPYPFRDPVECP